MIVTDRRLLSRRTFLTGSLSAVGAAATLATGCHGEESSRAPATNPPAPGTPSAAAQPETTIRIYTDVPGSLVFPGSASARRTTLVSIRQRGTWITLEDSDGRTVGYEAQSSFAEGIRTRNGNANRASVAPKIVAAHVLDATWQSLYRLRRTALFKKWSGIRGDSAAVEREVDSLRQLRRDFDALQEQTVLDRISVGALVTFLRSTSQRLDTLNRVIWDPRANRLVPSFL